MQMPDIKAGSNVNVGSGLDSEMRANESVMNAINQGVANQLSIIQNYQQRKHAREEAQKERDFKSAEAQKQMDWQSGENKLQREHDATEKGKDRKSQETMNQARVNAQNYATNTQAETAKKDRLAKQNDFINQYAQSVKGDIYVRDKYNNIVVDSNGMYLIKEEYKSDFAQWYKNRNNANTPMDNDGSNGLYSNGGSPDQLGNL